MSGQRRAALFWGAAAGVVILDIITKLLAVKYLLLHMPKRVVGDVVRFTLAYNPGAAFSMSLGSPTASRMVFSAFAIIAVMVLWRLYRAAGDQERLKILALGLACGGAIGNLIDRFRSPLGVGAVRFWTFNVADSAVTVGAVLLGWVLLQEDRVQRARVEATGGREANPSASDLPPPASSD